MKWRGLRVEAKNAWHWTKHPSKWNVPWLEAGVWILVFVEVLQWLL